jgi:hypothetical protein
MDLSLTKNTNRLLVEPLAGIHTSFFHLVHGYPPFEVWRAYSLHGLCPFWTDVWMLVDKNSRANRAAPPSAIALKPEDG